LLPEEVGVNVGITICKKSQAEAVVAVCDGARFKYILMGVMVFFLTWEKINTNQYYESDSLRIGNCGILREYMTLQKC
jgi:hypothetical protein